MQVRIEKQSTREMILALVLPFVLMMLTWRFFNKEMQRMGDSSVFIPIAYFLVGFAWVIRIGLNPKILTLQIADGMFVLNDGKKNIIEESEKYIELVLDIFRYYPQSGSCPHGALALRFKNRRSDSTIMVTVASCIHYAWKPKYVEQNRFNRIFLRHDFGSNLDSRAFWIYYLKAISFYDIDKEEALKIIRYYGIHSPLV